MEPMEPLEITVSGFIAAAGADIDLRADVWALALDQRAFGPRRLVVAFADVSGRTRSLAHAPRPDPPELALAPCIAHLGRGAAAAIAFCDEPVVEGPIPIHITSRFRAARAIAAAAGVHLVDWIACDDLLFRSVRLALEPDAEWWDVPGAIDW